MFLIVLLTSTFARIQPYKRNKRIINGEEEWGCLINKKTGHMSGYYIASNKYYAVVKDFVVNEKDYVVIADNQILAKTVHQRIFKMWKERQRDELSY